MTKRVCAIVVTYNRAKLLKRCLRAIHCQTYPISTILVVNNASIDETSEMLKKDFPNVKVLHLEYNKGGAGGFYEGIKWAYEREYEWLWLMDDDGFPSCLALEKLFLAQEEENLLVLAPIVINEEDHDLLAFGMVWKRKFVKTVKEIKRHKTIIGQANLFNGVLINRSVIDKIGLPNLDLFIRGDEVDYLIRLRKAKIKFATVTNATYYHPSGLSGVIPLVFGRFAVVDEKDKFKNYYTYRNRVYLFVKYKLIWYLILDFVRYSFYYLLIKREISGFRIWLKAACDGLLGRLGVVYRLN